MDCERRDALLLAILVATLVLVVLSYRMGGAEARRQKCGGPVSAKKPTRGFRA